MRYLRYLISIWLLINFFLISCSPLFAGGNEDFDCTADDSGGITPLANFIPWFMIDFDQHQGRGLVQLPPVVLPPMGLPAIVVQTQKGVAKCQTPSALKQENSIAVADEQKDSKEKEPTREFPHRRKEARVDKKFGREVITLSPGSPDNPYQVFEHGLFYFGAMFSVSFVEPNTLMQFNGMTKFKLSKGNSSHSRAKNYEDGIKKSHAKYPKKVDDFEKWENGDWIRRHTTFSMAFYAGVSYFLPEARTGIITEAVRSIHYQKLDEDHIRVSITKEIGAGVVARAQAAPFNKTEAKKQYNRERTYVYLFDLTKDDERKALEDVVERNVIFAGDEAYHAAKHDEATLLTSRLIKRNKATKSPWQVGIPLLARARMTWHTDKYRTEITTHRGDTQYFFVAKAYTKQTAWRHKNLKGHRGSHEGKKWKHFMDKHQQYNRSHQGGVVKPPKINGVDQPLQLNRQHDGSLQFTQLQPKTSDEDRKISYRYINIQRSFNNDRVEAKKVNSYIKKFLRKAGVNNYVVDVGYKSDAMIGYAEVRWDLRVGPNAINQVAKLANDTKKLFKDDANRLIDDYFSLPDGDVKNDPHNLCRSHVQNTNLCIRMLRRTTQKTLREIESHLRSLQDESVIKSAGKSASHLAKISRKLSTNQFVLQAFIMKLPPSLDGYGRLQVFGERFLGREFNTDPGQNMRENHSFTAPWTDAPSSDGNEEDAGIHDYTNLNDDDLNIDDEIHNFDWERINNRDAVNEF